MNGADPKQWSWTGFAGSVAFGAATAGAGRYLAPIVAPKLAGLWKGSGISAATEDAAAVNALQATESSGRDVSVLSAFAHEQEVLFRPGSRFLVLSNQVDPSKGVRVIQLLDVLEGVP